MNYCLALLLCLISSWLYADDKVLVVGSEQNYPPFALGMNDSEASGFTVELWRAVAKESHINSDIRVLPFHDVLQEFKLGHIDVLINLAESDERKTFADFTVPHVIVHGAVFVRQGDRRIQQESDLANKKIIVLNADLAHDYAIQQGWQTQLVLVDTSEQGFRLLADGQFDALLLSKLAGQQTLEKFHIHNIEALPIKVGFAQKFSFAVHKGNAELLAKINEGLALTKSSGVYDQLYEKWFGVYEQQALLPLLLRYLSPVIAFFSLLLAVILYRRSVERKQALIALQDSEARFRDLFDNAPLPYQSLDSAGRLLYVNQAWLALVNETPQPVIGRAFSEFVSPAHQAELSTLLNSHVEQSSGSLTLCLSCSRLVLLKWQIAKFNQPLPRLHCLLIDITERHEAEQTIKKHQLALTHLHNDLVQFTYVAAHHLQEPSRRLVTFVQRLQHQLSEYHCLNDDIQINLHFIEQSALRQKALVRDIQLYLSAAKPLGQIEQVNVSGILDKVVKHHSLRIRHCNALIDYGKLLPNVHIDAARLYDIFNILVDNALHYRHEERPLRVTIQAECQKGRVYISVADNGIGIPEHSRERVFFVFERLTTHTNPNSTGIGLSIMQRIVTSCHGSVRIEETLGGGTTVLFDLPE